MRHPAARVNGKWVLQVDGEAIRRCLAAQVVERIAGAYRLLPIAGTVTGGTADAAEEPLATRPAIEGFFDRGSLSGRRHRSTERGEVANDGIALDLAGLTVVEEARHHSAGQQLGWVVQPATLFEYSNETLVQLE